MVNITNMNMSINESRIDRKETERKLPPIHADINKNYVSGEIILAKTANIPTKLGTEFSHKHYIKATLKKAQLIIISKGTSYIIDFQTGKTYVRHIDSDDSKRYVEIGFVVMLAYEVHVKCKKYAFGFCVGTDESVSLTILTSNNKTYYIASKKAADKFKENIDEVLEAAKIARKYDIFSGEKTYRINVAGTVYAAIPIYYQYMHVADIPIAFQAISITITAKAKKELQKKTPVSILWYTDKIDWAQLANTKLYIVYVETDNKIQTIVVPEDIWANNYLASAIMTGTYHSKTPYIESAEISTVSSLGEAGNIEATIGLKTSRTTLSSLIEDIEKNATGQKAYSLVSVPEDQLARLTLIRGLMRAVPWEHIDPPDPPDISGWIADIEKAIMGALEEAYKALVNALSAAMSTVSGVLRGVASAFASGVRMLVAGIMAVVDFVVKLFKDLALLLWEFGQWFIGTLKNFVGRVAQALKIMIKAVAWIMVKAMELMIRAIKYVIENIIGIGLGSDLISLEARISGGVLEIRVWTLNYYYWEFGDRLPSMAFQLYFSKYYDWLSRGMFFNMTIVVPGIPVFMIRVNMDCYPADTSFVRMAGNKLSYGLEDEVFEDLENPNILMSLVGLFFTMGGISAVTTGATYAIYAASRGFNPATAVAFAVSIGALLYYYYSYINSFDDLIRSEKRSRKIFGLARYFLNLAVWIYLTYQALKRGNKPMMCGNAIWAMDTMPFNKVFPIFGGGFTLNMILLLLDLFNIDVPEGLTNPIIKYLISKYVVGKIIERVINQGIPYGTSIWKFFKVPRHRVPSMGRLITIIYIMLLWGPFLYVTFKIRDLLEDLFVRNPELCDVESPSIMIVEPSDGQELRIINDTIELRLDISVSDNTKISEVKIVLARKESSSSIALGHIVISGVKAITIIAQCTSLTASYSISKTIVLDASSLGIESGEYLLIVWARDIAGNERANYISLVVK